MPGICDDIIMDEEWLWQMLLNLLTNACKYTDKGSILLLVSIVSPRVAVSGSKLDLSDIIPDLTTPILHEADKLLFEVHDTG